MYVCMYVCMYVYLIALLLVLFYVLIIFESLDIHFCNLCTNKSIVITINFYFPSKFVQ